MPRLAFLAWGDFNAPSRFPRSAIPEEKWGTTRSLDKRRLCSQGVRTSNARQTTSNQVKSLFVQVITQVTYSTIV